MLLLAAAAPTAATPSRRRPLRLSKFHAPEIVFGHGSLSEAAHAAVRLGARRPFVVTDPGLLEAGWPAELIAPAARGAGCTPVVWNDVTPNPKDHEIEAGLRALPRGGLRRACSASAAAR